MAEAKLETVSKSTVSRICRPLRSQYHAFRSQASPDQTDFEEPANTVRR